ncbi:unnamed protein product [Prunus armeniaca]|uniref:Uncharacterized protein n=1 Tax=Prunus armeniaca TaxID=36596 RepID=A0A6J5UCS7_PRUAR|nr:unnamed protein product [Prunus armeniaca]CAB4304602.1 unnamed protein product [Prunus armeniaca]
MDMPNGTHPSQMFNHQLIEATQTALQVQKHDGKLQRRDYNILRTNRLAKPKGNHMLQKAQKASEAIWSDQHPVHISNHLASASQWLSEATSDSKNSAQLSLHSPSQPN